MEKFKGTKSKWYLENGGVSIWHPTDTGRRIALIDTKKLNADLEELANARLISFAPEMLEMLIEIRNRIQCGKSLTKTNHMVMIDSLITKATTV